jgi:hypothetical protein
MKEKGSLQGKSLSRRFPVKKQHLVKGEGSIIIIIHGRESLFIKATGRQNKAERGSGRRWK